MLIKLDKFCGMVITEILDELDNFIDTIYTFFDNWATYYPNLLFLCFAFSILFCCGGCCGLLSLLVQ